jgi:ketosteroid isomerase-like protein
MSGPVMNADDTEEFIHRLFAAWSSGDPDQVAPFFHPDAVLRDSVNGEFRGWPAIRALYVASLEHWGELTTAATRFWHGGDGSVAFTWTMRGRVLDDRLGPQNRDATCEFEGMSYVVVEDGRVLEEIEFFDRAAAAGSLGLTPSVSYG